MICKTYERYLKFDSNIRKQKNYFTLKHNSFTYIFNVDTLLYSGIPPKVYSITGHITIGLSITEFAKTAPIR